MIKVGIQTGVKFSSVELDEKKNVVITFTQGKEVDAMEALMGDGDFSGGTSSKVILWALKGKGYQDAPIEGKKVVEHLNQYKAFFNEILSKVFTADVAKNAWTKMFEGVEVKELKDIENLTAAQIEQVGININTIFVEKMKEADTTKEFTIKFYRSSPAKNFVTLKTDMFMKFQKKEEANGFRKTWTEPFIEDAVLFSTTKLAYSKYEKDKGWDNAAPVVADSMEAPVGDQELPF